MLELRIVSAGAAMPLFDLPAALGRRNAAREIGDAIESLIAFMDDLAGDPDLEDSETGSHMVDATGRYIGGNEPGAGDEDRELSWPEWHSRGRHKQTPGGYEMPTRGPLGSDMTDDDEDDDQDEEDGDEEDHGHAEDDECQHQATGPGCPMSDPGEIGGWKEGADGSMIVYSDIGDEHDGFVDRRAHRDRIRAERCDKIPARTGLYRDPFPTWRLRPSQGVRP